MISFLTDDLVAYAGGRPVDGETRAILEEVILDYIDGELDSKVVRDIETSMRLFPNVARLVRQTRQGGDYFRVLLQPIPGQQVNLNDLTTTKAELMGASDAAPSIVRFSILFAYTTGIAVDKETQGLLDGMISVTSMARLTASPRSASRRRCDCHQVLPDSSQTRAMGNRTCRAQHRSLDIAPCRREQLVRLNLAHDTSNLCEVLCIMASNSLVFWKLGPNSLLVVVVRATSMKEGKKSPPTLREQLVVLIPRLQMHALGLTRPKQTAEDLVQSTHLRALETLHQWTGGGRLDG